MLKAHEVAISMDGKGRAIDNVFIERLWRSLKYEEVYLKAYASLDEARPDRCVLPLLQRESPAPVAQELHATRGVPLPGGAAASMPSRFHPLCQRSCRLSLKRRSPQGARSRQRREDLF